MRACRAMPVVILWGLGVVVAVGAASVSALPTPEPGQEPDLDAIIERVLDAYGGRDRLAAIEAYAFDATLQTHPRGEIADVHRHSRGHDTLEVMIQYAERTEVRELDVGRGWRGDSLDDLRPVRGPMLDSMRTQALRANLPWALVALRDRVELIEAADDHVMLGIKLPGEAAVRFRIEADSGRITRSESAVGMGGSTMVFATDYSDFRQVEGVLFPFHEESWAQDTHTGSIDIQELTWNPPDARGMPGEER